MATVDRPVGCMIGIDTALQESDGVYIEAVNSIEEGTSCAGCEKEIELDSGVECYCAVEDFGYAHEQYRWCTQECFNQTHEDYHPDPMPLFDE